MVTNPRTTTLAPVRALLNDGLFLGRDGDHEQWRRESPDEVSSLLSVNSSESSATMMNCGIDPLTGDALEESVGLDAGEIRVVREEAA